MQLGRVVGNVVLNIKNETLSGVTLLLVQPISSAREPVGRVIVAADSVGAGVGEHVFFVRGKEASFPFYPTEVPADAGIVGIVDHWTVHTAQLKWRPSKRERVTGVRPRRLTCVGRDFSRAFPITPATSSSTSRPAARSTRGCA